MTLWGLAVGLICLGMSPIPLLAQPALQDLLEEQLIQGMNQGMKGDLLAAIAIFSSLIARHPDYADAYFNRGIAYRKLGKTPAAIADFDQAINFLPTLAEAYHERALLRLELGENSLAQQDLERAAKLYQAQQNPHGDRAVKLLLQQIP